MIEIILESFSSLFKSFDLFLQTKDLTLGAILAGITPFIVIWIKLSKEREKKARSLLIERRQMQIAFNINEIMEALKVESKWSIQEIGSSHEDLQMSKKSFLLSRVVTILRRKKKMILLKNPWSKKLFAFLLLVLVNGMNDTLGLNLSHDTVHQITGVGQIYIISQAAVDMVKPFIMIILSKFSVKQEVNDAKLPMDTESSV